MLELTTNQVSYFKDTKTFSEYASSLNLPATHWNSLRAIPVDTLVALKNPDTGVTKVFEFVETDFSDGEAMGWNYKKDGLHLLIIND